MHNFKHLFKPLSERIEQAREHMRIHGGGEQALWPFQAFSMSVDELLSAASSEPFLGGTKEHLKEAYQHVLSYEQENDALWAYQNFCMSIGELLEAAIYHFEPSFVSQTRSKMAEQKAQYEKYRIDAYTMAETKLKKTFF